MPNYQKGTKDNRAENRAKKRRYQGNQFTDESGNNFASSADSDNVQSASAKKLSTADSDDIHSNPSHTYKIIEFVSVFTALASILLCYKCKQHVRFEESGHRGLGFKINVVCRCGRTEINSGPLIHTGYEINRRIVFVMRLLGVGCQGINTFCNLMDMCTGLANNSYSLIIGHISVAATSIFNNSCKNAVQQEIEKNKENGRTEKHLKVSGDGSWKKRGFKSLYGVTTLIGYYTGKVIDVVVKSSYCQACIHWKKKMHTVEYQEWLLSHEEECTINHDGSAGKMEVDSVKEMFLRSEEKFGVKYTNYIGDGDSKTFKAILDSKPYGDEVPIIKSECINHVEKRMHSRLQKIKKEKKLGGRNKLTDKIIKNLTKYYGLSIQRNKDSIENMKNAIMATYFHIFSTKDEPNHGNCPTGPDSWCKWQKAVALNKDPKLEDMPPLLPQEMKEHLLPIYEHLSTEDLLERCLGGHTQNANESFNATVWRLAPKHLHCGQKIIEIASCIAAGVFNDGLASILRIMNKLDIVVGTQALNFAKNADNTRIARQNRMSQHSSKEARIARKQHELEQNQLFEEAEGLLYAPGVAD